MLNLGEHKQETCYNTYGQDQSLMHQLMLFEETILLKSMPLVRLR